MNLSYSEYTSAGFVRQNNQDSIFSAIRDNYGLFIIADGMGGHFGGEIASCMLKTALSDWWGNFTEETGFEESCEQIKKIIEETNSAIYNQYSSQGKICGTTLALLFFYNDRYLLINTGDSRIYSYSRWKLRQESVDHVFSEEKKITGELTDDEIEMHRNKNKLTSAIGCKKNFKMNIKTAPLDRKTTFFLCSDGVYKLCDDKLIRRAVKIKDSTVMTEMLKNNIEENGASDNFSFIRIGQRKKKRLDSKKFYKKLFGIYRKKDEENDTDRTDIE